MRTGDIAYLLQQIQQDQMIEEAEASARLSQDGGVHTRKPSPRPERQQGESTQSGEL